jgi:outer membrane protein
MLKKAFVSTVLIVAILTFSSLSFAQPQSLSIRDCIQIALKNNPDLKNADRRIRLAGTGVTLSRANILPSFGINLSGSRAFQSEQGPYLRDVPIQDPVTGLVRYVQQEIFLNEYYRNSYSSSASLNQNIYDGGRWWNQIKQSNALYRGSEHNFKATRESVIANVTQWYYNLLKSKKLQEVYEKAVESANEQLKRTESMYEVGAVAQADVFRAKVLLGDQQTLLIQQRNAVSSNLANLNLALGWEPNRNVNILEEDVEIEPIDKTLEEVMAMAEQANPELKGLAETVKSGQYGIKIAKSSFLPNLSFSANYSRFNNEYDRLYNPFDKNYQMSGRFTLSWNIFNGFTDYAQVERASINYYIDKEQLISRKLSIKSEIEQSYRNLKAYDEIETINEDHLKSAQEDLRLNQERYRIGSGTLLEVVDSQVNLIRAQSTLISTKYNRQMELANLYAQIGIVEQKLKPILQ